MLFDCCQSAQFSEEDTNGDGKNDALDFTIDFAEPLNVTSVQLLLFFNVQLSVRQTLLPKIIHYAAFWK